MKTINPEILLKIEAWKQQVDEQIASGVDEDDLAPSLNEILSPEEMAEFERHCNALAAEMGEPDEYLMEALAGLGAPDSDNLD